MINRQIIKDQFNNVHLFKLISTSLIILLKQIDSFKFRFHDKISIVKAVYSIYVSSLATANHMKEQVGINVIIMHYQKNHDSLVLRPFLSFTIARVTHTYLYDLIHEYVGQQRQTSLKASEYGQVLIMKREALVALYRAEKASLLWLYEFGPGGSSSLISPYTYRDQAFNSYSMVYPELIYGDTIDIKLQLRYMNLYDKCSNHSKGITVQIYEDNTRISPNSIISYLISTSTFHLNLFNYLISTKNNHIGPFIHYQLFDLASGTLEYVCILDKPILVGRVYMDKPEFNSKLIYHFITTIIETLKDTIPLIIEQSIQWTLQY